MRFEKEQVVTESDIDDLNHVNNVIYVQWIQDISKEHWVAKASKELQEEVMWVVLSHFVEYKGAAVLNDRIRITTYIKESKGARCTRVVEMFNVKTGNLLLQAKTEWCLLSRETSRPMRISKELEGIFMS